MNKYIVAAVDEAGRGPLAGPIAVAALAATVKFKSQTLPIGRQVSNLKSLSNIKDSKKLSVRQREKWLGILKNNFEYRVVMVGPRVIDRIGIQRATHLAVARALRNLRRSIASTQKVDLVLLDGLLHAPKHYYQRTIIKGDEKVPLISAASIVAKVYRDRKMEKLHTIFPDYGFDRHKGYGTKFHYKMIKKYGLLKIHRKSFTTRI